MPRKLLIAAAIALVVVVLVSLIPLAASSLGKACEFGPCEPTTPSR